MLPQGLTTTLIALFPSVSGDPTLHIAEETEPHGREETAWQEEGRDRNTWVSYPTLEQSLLLQQLERH